MCGIAGIASLDGSPVPPEALKRMADALAHRGPDDAGYALFRSGTGCHRSSGSWSEFVDPEFRHVCEHLPVLGGSYYQDEVREGRFTLGLAHRRLSILDLSARGHQPMPSPDRRYWVCFNGEIYNFRELRRELEADGHAFRTGSDTEVALRLWQEHGDRAIERLDGMFALALFDREEGRLVLARDRFGVKPVYFGVDGPFFLFASEIKAILASGLFPASLDPSALVEYLTFQNLFRSGTLFSGISILPPGSLLSLRPGHGPPERPRRWFRGFPPPDPALADRATAAPLVSETFAAAVSRQLVADVEVGSYLSGGMDSGSIVAVAGRTLPRLLTFTCGFDLTNVDGIEQGFDERRNAEQLSYLLQTEHYDVVLHAGDMPAVMDRVAWHMDDPRVGMCHQNWYAAKLASRFVKVCLAGAGGDELFAGYPWRYRQGIEAGSVEAFDDAYFRYWHRLLPPAELPGLLAPDLRTHLGETRASFDAVMARAPHPGPGGSDREALLARALAFEFETFLHGFLVTEDRISMAHSLETRVPFLDNALADLAFSLPVATKVDMETLGGHEGSAPMATAEGKMVLRTAMESYLPPEFTRQKKQGFSPPDENWFRGPSMDYLKAVLLDPRTLARPWFDPGFMTARLDEHFTGRRNHRLLIWSLLSVELLQRHFLDAPASGPGSGSGPDTVRGRGRRSGA